MDAMRLGRTLDEIDWLLLAGQTFYAREKPKSRPSSSSSWPFSVLRSNAAATTNNCDDGASQPVTDCNGNSSDDDVGGDIGGRIGGDISGRTGDDIGGRTGDDIGGDISGRIGGDIGGDIDGRIGGDIGGGIGGDIGGGIGSETMLSDVASDRPILARFAPRCISRFELELEWSHAAMNDHAERLERLARRLASERRFVLHDERNGSLAMRVRSYGIARTWNLLRHVYLELDDVEIHSGMAYDESREIVYTTRDYFGAGRIEGYLSLCRACTSSFIMDVRRKTNEFFLPFNNCDTIVPFVMQTPTIWFGTLGAVIGTMLSVRTHNFFTFALFVPFIAFCLTAFCNSRILDAEDRADYELAQCAHVEGGYQRISVESCGD